MRNRVPWRRGLAAMLASALLLSAVLFTSAVPVLAQSYGGGSSASPAASATASPMASATSAPAQVTLTVGSTSTLGSFLVAPNGRTLYTLSSDPMNGSVCTGQCPTFWPPLEVAAGGSASVTGASVTLGSFVRADTGATQVSLDGHALYNFKGDTAPGQTNGEGIKALGGVWHVAAVASLTGTGGSSAAPSAATGSSLPPTDEAPSGPADQPLALSLLLLVAALAAASSFAFLARQPRRR
jgi:predicted lipoprotein with Yx(FWY)xxD motif